MPFTFILLLIFAIAAIFAIVGFTKKIRVLNIIAALLFFLGVILILFLIFALKNM